LDKNEKQNSILEIEDKLFKDYGTMVSGFIHDINNPIAVITGQISILETLQKMQKLDDEKILKVSSKIITATQKVGTYIELIRGFYKPYESTDTETDIVHSLTTILKLSQTKIYRGELELKFNCELEEFKVNIIPKDITLILWNYINFVIDFSILNKEPLTINLIKTPKNCILEFKVMGIDKIQVSEQISLQAVQSLADMHNISISNKEKPSIALCFKN